MARLASLQTTGSAAFGPAGKARRKLAPAQVRAGRAVQGPLAIKADLVVRRQSEYRELEFTRRRTLAVGDLTVAVVSPEDLILSKLDWARDSASASQYQDVAQLLSTVPDLDFDYLEHWAGALGVRERLRELGRP